MRRDWIILGAVAVAIAGSVGCARLGEEKPAPTAKGGVDFHAQIEPIFEASCYQCHGAKKKKGGLRLDKRATALEGGDSGRAAIEPGDGAASLLIQAMTIEDSDDFTFMPVEGDALTAEQIALIKRWIDEGASWGEDVGEREIASQSEPEFTEPGVFDWVREILNDRQAARERAQMRRAARKRSAAGDPIVFNRDIRHILTDNCFTCHGPDPKQRKAGLRLDRAEAATERLRSGNTPIVAFDRRRSELFRRVTAHDPGDRMPPVDSGKKLTAQEIERLGRWIDQGGEYQKHWAFIAPTRPELPKIKNKGWPKNEIDAFVLARLEKEGLEPSPEANRRTLIRRVTLDLTGLPPTLDEVEAFANDGRPEAYGQLVDRLLDSPRYGEQMARYWLDAARYADTNGYHIDNERFMWRWRDWVINAFNRNMPFDEFTIEQLAGDELPNATIDQQIASGFNRNHMINFEGGAIPEEYQAEYVLDRVRTTGTIWMGLTVGCAQCHDHKFDPISQREFYQLFSFFNTIPEKGLDGQKGNSAPFMKAPMPEQKARLARMIERIESLQEEMNEPMPEVDAAQTQWEERWSEKLAARWTVLDPETYASSGGSELTKLDDLSILVGGENPDQDVYEVTATVQTTGITAVRLEALTDESLPHGGAGRHENANFVLSEFEFEALPSHGNSEEPQKIEFDTAFADYSQKDFPIGQAIDGDAETGWAVEGNNRRERRTAVFVCNEPFGFEKGTKLRLRLRHETKHSQHGIGRFRISVTSDAAMTPSRMDPWRVIGPFEAESGDAAFETAYEPETEIDFDTSYGEGKPDWRSEPDFTDGQTHELAGENCATYLYRVVHAASARKMELGLGSDDAIKVWVNGRLVHENNARRAVAPDQDRVTIDLDRGENRLLLKIVNFGGDYGFYFNKTSEQTGGVPVEIERVMSIASAKRGEDQVAALREYYRRENSPRWRTLDEERTKAENEKKKFEDAIPTVMVMQEMEEPRETFVLNRGQYDQHGDKVEAATPKAFPPLPEGETATRLGFARWLVDPSHPLTARVTVNRLWQHAFGKGLVRTTEDFGTQGAWPTHPDLLDWLATEFIDSGWDVKHMQRLIVTSAIYRQDSRIRPELLEKDKENRLLARGPRFRMDAEMVRDNALAIGGLLVEQVGGASVKPYQPQDLWKEVAYGDNFSAQIYKQDQGEALYRRSMYTFWKRQCPPPSMLIFDAPSREICTVRRARTNTPLQALALMNDPQFVEAARSLAQRMMTEAGPETEARIDYAFRLATARSPARAELDVFEGIFEAQLDEFRRDEDAANDLLAIGESECNGELDRAELAAWTIVANMILNLDETITKG